MSVSIQTHKLLVSCSAIILSGLIGKQALAQNASAAPSAVPSAPVIQTAPQAPDQIQEVVVSARRVREAAQSVPIAITAISGAQLQRDGISQADDLTSHVPSLNVERDIVGGDALPVFTIRGLGQELGSEPTVVVYFAETPSDTRFVGNTLYDLSSVQVLKGPQGTLFGKNSIGGAVLLEPQKPTDQYDGFVSFREGNYGAHEGTAVLNLPINDKVDLRVAGNFISQDGYLRNTLGKDFDNKDRNSIRVSLTVRPFAGVENYTMLQSYYLDQRELGGQLTAEVPCPIFKGNCLFSPPTSTLLNTPNIIQAYALQQALGPRAVADSSPSYDRNKDLRLTNITTDQIGDITLKNIFSFNNSKAFTNVDLDGTVVPLFSTIQDNHINGISDEFQIQGRSFNNRLKWIGGVFYNDTTDKQFDVTTAFLTPTSLTTPQERSPDDNFKSEAVFVQGTYDLGQWISGLEFTAGYRYTWDQRTESVSAFVVPTGNCALVAPGGAFLPFTDSTCTRRVSADFSAYGYTVGLDYHLSKQLLLYVSHNRSYKAGGFNPSAVQEQYLSYAPEYVEDTELGVKSDWRVYDVPFRLNASIYKTDFTNIQLEDSNVDPSSKLQQTFVYNGSSANLQGGEFEFTINPVKGLQLNASYALNYGSYSNLISVATGVPVDIGKHAFTRVPRESYHLSAYYSFDTPPSIGQVSLYAEYYHQMSVAYLATRPVGPLNTTPAYGIGNVRLDISNVLRSPADLSFYVKNVGNNLYETYAIDDRASLGFALAAYGEPRTYGVQVTYHFGAGAAR